MDIESFIRSSAAQMKIFSASELGRRIGVTNRATMCRKLKKPTTLTIPEIQALAELLNWNNAELGEFIRGIQ